jgi:hypothetical protein
MEEIRGYDKWKLEAPPEAKDNIVSFQTYKRGYGYPTWISGVVSSYDHYGFYLQYDGITEYFRDDEVINYV